MEESKRTLVGNIGLALALTVSGVYQPWLVKALGDWKVFNWILFAQMALVIATPLIMPESCRYPLKDFSQVAMEFFRWLLSMGEGEKTVKIMKRIAKMNGKEVSIEKMLPQMDIEGGQVQLGFLYTSDR